MRQQSRPTFSPHRPSRLHLVLSPASDRQTLLVPTADFASLALARQHVRRVFHALPQIRTMSKADGSVLDVSERSSVVFTSKSLEKSLAGSSTGTKNLRCAACAERLSCTATSGKPVNFIRIGTNPKMFRLLWQIAETALLKTTCIVKNCLPRHVRTCGSARSTCYIYAFVTAGCCPKLLIEEELLK